MGQASTRIFYFFGGKFCVFSVFFSCFKMFQNWIGGGLVASDQFEFFSDFFDFFNLTIPLSKHLGRSIGQRPHNRSGGCRKVYILIQ